MKSLEIRQSFLDFFKSKGHVVVPPAPVFIENDPTLLFTNAGMNQFKDVFLGEGTRPYTRAVDSQICVRVSGKHNDLEDVGFDSTHQTSFEMLGNWSFGDYYKAEAITWAWEWMTKVLGVHKAKLFASVYEKDDESFDLWERLTDIDSARISRHGKKDNFWEMGATGPCGPCSEIHVDLGPEHCMFSSHKGHVCEVNGDCGRIIELWNLVFIQYNRQQDGSLLALPKTHVDTGAGLERVCSYLNGTYTNYRTDLYEPLLHRIADISGVQYQDNSVGVPHRVMADHVRTLCFAIGDNVMPSNEGRGYVLRRLLRRALRYAKNLGIDQPVLYQLVDLVAETMSGYGEVLDKRKSHIASVIKAEENSFLKTLESGLEMVNQLVETKKAISGEDAFKLYDTFGFPIDLTQVLAREKGIAVDMAEFERLLQQQKEKSRESTKKKLAKVQSKETIKVNPDVFDTTKLHLAEDLTIARGGEAKVIADPEEKLSMARHHTGTHVLHEALRRVLGDHVQQAGSLVDVDRLRFDFTHMTALTDEQLSEVEKVCNEIIQQNQLVTVDFMPLDEAKKLGVMALFGEKYDPERVRVVQIGDFSKELCGGTHVASSGDIQVLKILSDKGIAAGTRRIEALCGDELVEVYEFEKTRDIIRSICKICKKIISFNIDEDQLTKNKKVVEVKDGLEKEIRKTFPLKRDSLQEYLTSLESWMSSLLQFSFEECKSNIEKLSNFDALLRNAPQKLEFLMKEIPKIDHKQKSQQATGQLSDYLKDLKTIGSLKALSAELESFDVGMLRNLSDALVNVEKGAVVALGSNVGGKAVFLVKIGSEVKNLNANDLIKVISNVAGGGGGGRPDMAQAGGGDPSKISEALDAFEKHIETLG